MDSIRKPLGYLLCLLGVIVLVQFVAYPIYWETLDGIAWDIWGYINLGTATGSVVALIVSFIRWRNYDRSSLRDAIATGGMFMLAGAFALLYFEQWPAGRLLVEPGESVPEFRGFIWVAVDVLFPVLMAWVGSWLLRSE